MIKKNPTIILNKTYINTNIDILLRMAKIKTTAIQKYLDRINKITH